MDIIETETETETKHWDDVDLKLWNNLANLATFWVMTFAKISTWWPSMIDQEQQKRLTKS